MVLAPPDAMRDALNDSFISLMKAIIHMKELQEKEEEDGPDNFDDEEDVDEDSENDDVWQFELLFGKNYFLLSTSLYLMTRMSLFSLALLRIATICLQLMRYIYM